MRRVKAIAVVGVVVFSACCLMAQGGTQIAPPGNQIIERISPSAVLILAGNGDGQVAGLGSGVILRPDGVILTANHVIKGMRELQIRLKNGEVYDQVELIAADERRDVAALRIPAMGLPVLPMGNSSSIPVGAPVFAMSNGAGLPWTASSGILSATRMADEVPGAGNGYRLLQFTAPMSPGSSGGVFVDAEARILGIIIGSFSIGQNVNFAVPVENVAGLGNGSGGTKFESGARLQLPGAPAAFAAPSPSNPPKMAAAPKDLTLPPPEQRKIRTISVLSKTIYLRRERLQDDMTKTPLFQQLGLRFADYGQVADVAITVDRPVMTYDWTFSLVYQPRDLTLTSGMIEAVDEYDAGPKLASVIAEQLAAALMIPAEALDAAKPPAGGTSFTSRQTAVTPADILRTASTIFVESHTIWMKGNLLQDALYVRPEIRTWGMRIVDDRNGADIYIDITRPFLTYDWDYKMIHLKTGTVLGTGKVLAIDGPAAAQRLAIEIVNRIRTVRPPAPQKAP